MGKCAFSVSWYRFVYVDKILRRVKVLVILHFYFLRDLFPLFPWMYQRDIIYVLKTF